MIGSTASDTESGELSFSIGHRWVLPVTLAILLVVISFQNYLLFHTLAELFAIAVAVLAAAVVWQTYPFSNNHYLMYLGCGYIWIAALDLVHALFYKGMSIFPVTEAYPASQFWIVARYYEALLLLTALLFLNRAFNRHIATSLFGIVAVVLYALVLSGNFPDAFVEGQGLTTFKVASEYVIIGILIAALVFLWRQRERMDRHIHILITASITLTMCAELAFAFYVSVYGFSNLVGHILKLFSYWLIFEAIVLTTLKEPFRALNRYLLLEMEERRQTEKALLESQSMHEEAQQLARLGHWTLDLVKNELSWSDEIYRIFEIDPGKFEASYAVFLNAVHPDEREQVNQAYIDSVKNRTAYDIVHRLLMKDGTVKYVNEQCHTFYDNEGKPLRSIGTVQDITERMQTEEALCIERDNLKNIFEAMKDGIYIVNQQYDIQYVNPALEKDFGIYEGRKCYEYFHERTEICPWCKNPEVFTGKTVHWERYSTKNRRTYDLIDTPLKNSDGSTLKLEIFRDITERKKAEDALREREQFINRALNASITGIYIYNLEKSHNEYINSRYTAFTGYSLDEINAMAPDQFLGLFHPVDRERVFAHMEKVARAEDEEVIEIEYRFRTRDGRWIWCRSWDSVFQRNEEGGVLRFIGTFLDITERKRMEEELSLWAHVYEHANWGIVLCKGGSMCFDRVNTAFAHERGYSAGEMHDLDIRTVFPPDIHADLEEQVERAERLGHTSYESVHVRKDGSRFPVWIEVSVAYDEQGKPLYRAGNVLDITERKQGEIEREQLLQDLGERVKELRCVFGITEAIRKHSNLEDILYDTISIIPQGWRYPEYTAARIILDDKEFIESPFGSTEWKQASDLIIGNRYRGCVEVYYTKEFPELDEGPFLKHERSLLDGIAKTLCEAIERKNAEAELQHLVTHDALTGLYNRKILEQRLTNEILRAARYERALSIFLLDIDHFKQINDTYGHQAGDAALHNLARILKESVRKTDYAARYGGEEFVIVLPETSLSKAEVLAERLRNNIAEHPIQSENDRELKITVSVGIAMFPDHAQSLQDLVKAADMAMYEAKIKGRNRVQTANSAG